MFAVDTKTENYLRNIGVKYDYREGISYDELIPEWNNQNHGRPKGQARVETAIETYAMQQADGSPMPACVVHKTRQGLDPLDGIQRLNGNQLNDYTRFGAYVVRCNDATALKIRICINNFLAGIALNPNDFAIDKMVSVFMIEGNESAADVSAFLGRTVGDVERHYARQCVNLRIRALYEDPELSPDLNEGVKDKIAQHSDPSDFDGAAGSVVRKALEVIQKCRFKNGDSCRLLTDFFTIKRTGSKNRATQLNSKLRQLKADPVVKTRLAGKRTSTGVDNINKHFATLLNAAKKHKKEGEKFDSIELIEAWDEKYREIGRLLREQCTNQVRRKLDPFA